MYRVEAALDEALSFRGAPTVSSLALDVGKMTANEVSKLVGLSCDVVTNAIAIADAKRGRRRPRKQDPRFRGKPVKKWNLGMVALCENMNVGIYRFVRANGLTAVYCRDVTVEVFSLHQHVLAELLPEVVRDALPLGASPPPEELSLYDHISGVAVSREVSFLMVRLRARFKSSRVEHIVAECVRPTSTARRRLESLDCFRRLRS